MKSRFIGAALLAVSVVGFARCASTESPETFEQQRRGVDRDLAHARADLVADGLWDGYQPDQPWAFGSTMLCKGSDDKVGYVIDALVTFEESDTSIALRHLKDALQETGFEMEMRDPGYTGFGTLRGSKGSTQIVLVPGHPTITDGVVLTGSTACVKVGAKQASRLAGSRTVLR